MEKKTIFYILGGVAVIGIGYYLWSKNKKAGAEKEETDDAKKEESTDDTATDSALKKSDATENKTAPTKSSTSSVKKLTAQELESKLQSGCGKKPKLKKNKKKYEQCRADLTAKLKSQGLVAFDGSYDDTYDFEGESVIDKDFFSGFDSNFDLNL